MPRNVFTYGSLMFAPVWQRVVRGTYDSAPARLSGHRRHALVGESYPGVVPEAGSEVAGLLYFDVDDDDLLALDRFEGDEYRRCSVEVATDLATAPVVGAETYLFEARHRLSEQPWLPEEFAMQRFLETYCRDNAGQ